jgi:hypothetical protein
VIVAIHLANQARNAAVKAQAASDELRREAQEGNFGGVGGVDLGFGNRSHAVAYDIFVEVSCVPRQMIKMASRRP